jgi:hypothetical protein
MSSALYRREAEAPPRRLIVSSAIAREKRRAIDRREPRAGAAAETRAWPIGLTALALLRYDYPRVNAR